MPHHHRAGVLLRFQDEILIVLSHEGKWSIPKGSLKMNESYQQCAHREMLEETGIDVDLTHATTMNVPNCKVFLMDVQHRIPINMDAVTSKHEVALVAWKNVFDPSVYHYANSGLKRYIEAMLRQRENVKCQQQTFHYHHPFAHLQGQQQPLHMETMLIPVNLLQSIYLSLYDMQSRISRLENLIYIPYHTH